jgi:hypothetical protein
VNFFIWVVIKNYWCDIKSGNVLILIGIKKYEKEEKKNKEQRKKSGWTVISTT